MSTALINMAYRSANGATFAIKPASPTAELLQKRLKNKVYRMEDAELYKRCGRCKDYWPADTEFFHAIKGDDGLNSWCKACHHEWRYPNGRSQKNEQQQEIKKGTS